METQNPTIVPPTVPPVPKVYFYKEIYSNKYIANGKAVDFEQLDGNSGVIVLDPGRDDALIHALQDAASKHMGGIVPISAEQYEELKKNRPFSPSAARLRQEKLRTLPHRPFGPKEPVVAGDNRPAKPADAPSGDPSPVVREQAVALGDQMFKPATRRMAREKAA